jgi:hypothetical protein
VEDFGDAKTGSVGDAPDRHTGSRLQLSQRLYPWTRALLSARGRPARSRPDRRRRTAAAWGRHWPTGDSEQFRAVREVQDDLPTGPKRLSGRVDSQAGPSALSLPTSQLQRNRKTWRLGTRWSLAHHLLLPRRFPLPLPALFPHPNQAGRVSHSPPRNDATWQRSCCPRGRARHTLQRQGRWHRFPEHWTGPEPCGPPDAPRMSIPKDGGVRPRSPYIPWRKGGIRCASARWLLPSP